VYRHCIHSTSKDSERWDEWSCAVVKMKETSRYLLKFVPVVVPEEAQLWKLEASTMAELAGRGSRSGKGIRPRLRHWLAHRSK